jgi:hypothetical protein
MFPVNETKTLNHKNIFRAGSSCGRSFCVPGIFEPQWRPVIPTRGILGRERRHRNSGYFEDVRRRIVNHGALSVRIQVCEFLDDTSTRGIAAAFAVQKWDTQQNVGNGYGCF